MYHLNANKVFFAYSNEGMYMRTRTIYGGVILICLAILMGTTSTFAVSDWPVNEGDIYYVVWTSHPANFGAIPTASPTSPVYEKVNVTYSGPAFAAHDPTAYFSHSINISGELWDGAKWNDISSGESTQLALYNGSGLIWFCGGLFSGVPVIAPNGMTESNRKLVIQIDTGVLWTGTTTMTEDTSNVPTRWLYTNGANVLTVAYDADGFISYYYLQTGNYVFECKCMRELPNLPTVSTSTEQFQIGGFTVQGMILVIGVAVWFIIRKSKQ
jgi:hypothetical protein